MQIGMIADLYKPHISGVTNYISLSKQYLEKRGHDVFVFTFGSEGYVDDELNIIRSPGVPVSATGMQFNLNYSKTARHLLRSMDVVHVHHPFISGPLAIRYCKPHKIPIVFTAHTRYDLYAQAYLPAIADLIGESAIQAFLPTFCRLCDQVIAPSQGMREVLIELGVHTPIEVVPHGISLDSFYNPTKHFDRSELGFDPKNVVLIYSGRLAHEKNISFLFSAFQSAVEQYPYGRLLIVGDGPLRKSLQLLIRKMGIENKVHFTGSVPYAFLPSYLHLADIFVTASVTETFGLNVIEAMASGLPVIGINSPGIGDIINDGVTGYLCTHNLFSFYEKMITLIANKSLREEMGQKAIIASSEYSIQHTTRVILQIYEATIERAKRQNRQK